MTRDDISQPYRVLLVVTALAWLWGCGTPAAEGPARVVLGDFQNRTGESLLDDSLDIAFRAGLEQADGLEILPHDRLAATAEGDAPASTNREAWIETARREGARAYVFGSVARAREGYSLNAEVIDPGTGQAVFATRRAAARRADLLDELQDIVREVRAHLRSS